MMPRSVIETTGISGSITSSSTAMTAASSSIATSLTPVEFTPVRARARFPVRRRCTWSRAQLAAVPLQAPRSRSARGGRRTCRADGRVRWRRRSGSHVASSSAMPSWRRTARPWAAKASFSSITSKSPMFRPRRFISFSEAGAGPMPMMRGGTPATAPPENAGARGQAVALGSFFGGDDERRGAVVDARRIAGGHGAVRRGRWASACRALPASSRAGARPGRR